MQSVLAEDVIDAIAAYVCEPPPIPRETLRTASLALADSLGCAIGALGDADCRRLLGPVVPGTIVPHGARVPGRPEPLDPVKAAFDTAALIRWLDFNDTTPVGGHPSDNLGAILAVADHLSQMRMNLRMADVLRAMVLAYEIQGCLAEANRFDRKEIGLDTTHYVLIASTAVAARLFGGDAVQLRNAISNAWLDGPSPTTYRHPPNAGTRKGWASADATSRGVFLAWLAMRGEMGYPQPLSAPGRGFSDVYLKGAPVRLDRPLGHFFMDRVIFKLFPCQRNGSTAVECALRLHEWLRSQAAPIAAVEIQTHDEVINRICHDGPLPNAAARDHCLQYMVAVALLKGSLTSEDYSDTAAADPAIDRLRGMIRVAENPDYSAAHHDLDRGSCASSMRITLADGQVSPFVEIHHPAGDPVRRAEALPLLIDKFHSLTRATWPEDRRSVLLDRILDLNALSGMAVNDFITSVS
jgi:2-methylcitrate dehydratase